MKQITVKIHFPLPFYIPVESDETFGFSVDKEITHRFKFKTLYGEKSRIGSGNDNKTTIVSEVTYELSDNNISTQDLVLSSVKNSITTINNYLDALRLDSNLNFIQNFSISDLPLVIDFEIDGSEGEYITQPTKILQLTLLTSDRIDNATKNALGRLRQWYENPQLDVIDKFLSKGIHHLYTEEFTFAIVELQTSFETYIRLCQRIILSKLGKTESEIETAMSIPFKNTIQQHIGPALNANLKFDENSIIKEWNDKLYSLRNKIVHKGESYITGEAAYEAFDAFQDAINYITGLMVDNGFMNENGKIEISDFNKNTPTDVDRQKVSEALKKQGHFKKNDD